jgi:hypothetical protein
MAQNRHGGRRHGLSLRGPADRLLVSLSPADRRALERLCRDRGAASMAEVVRELIREADDTYPARPDDG